jgi:transcriptional regulator with XRE-family HTH domain
VGKINIFGEHIREARIKKEMTMRDVAVKTSVEPVFISDIENGIKIPQNKIFIIRLCRALDLDVSRTIEIARICTKLEEALKDE